MIYTVVSVSKQEREPVIQGKTFYSYELGLVEHTPKVQLLQNPSTPAPQPGDQIDGTIEPGKQKEDGSKWPDRLKRAPQQQRSQGGYPSDPNREKRIVRQHSQEMAIRYAAYSGGPTVALEQIKEWTDWFDSDVASVASSPSEPPTEPPKPQRAPVPTIPLDRAKSILEAAQKVGLAFGTDLSPVLKAKLTDVGVETQMLGHLNVDQAEELEAFISQEQPA